MAEQNPSKMKSALNAGAVLGLVFIVLNLITYVFEMYEHQWFSYVSWGVLLAGIIVTTKNYRDKVCNGYISYGGAFGYGVLVTLFASIIASIFSYIYLSFIDGSMIDFILEKTEMGMIEGGAPEESIEQSMAFMSKLFSPMGLTIFGIVGSTLLGVVMSLITSAFLKNEAENFEDVQ